MDVRHFKGLVKTGASPGAAVLRKPLISDIQDMDGRRIRYTISTGSEDREGDMISVGGWDLEAFRRNPVVLWGHRAGDLPIARCVELGVTDNALWAVAEFVPADMPEVGERAEAVLRMSRTGFLAATSVGFRPLEYEIAKERMDDDDWWPPLNFLRQELLEFSVVSIPANAEALIDPDEQVDVARLAFEATTAARRLADQQAAAHARHRRRLALLSAYR